MKLNREYSKKRRTRAVLIESALSLMGEGKSLESLGLREVARKAELAPAAFYRHFKDLEDLGLALVEDVSTKLRAILREVRKKGLKRTSMDKSINLFFDYMKSNKILFRFVVREQNGVSSKIRSAIRKELGFFANELAMDLPLGISPAETEFLSQFVVSTCFGIAGEYLDFGVGSNKNERLLKKKALSRLILIYRGAYRKKFEKSN